MKFSECASGYLNCSLWFDFRNCPDLYRHSGWLRRLYVSLSKMSAKLSIRLTRCIRTVHEAQQTACRAFRNFCSDIRTVGQFEREAAAMTETARSPTSRILTEFPVCGISVVLWDFETLPLSLFHPSHRFVSLYGSSDKLLLTSICRNTYY